MKRREAYHTVPAAEDPRGTIETTMLVLEPDVSSSDDPIAHGGRHEEPIALETGSKKKRVRPLAFDGIHALPCDHGAPAEAGPSLFMCRIERTKSIWGYELRLIADDTGEALLTAQRKTTSGNYHIYDVSCGIIGKKLKKKGGNYLGKIAAASPRDPYHRVLLDNGDGDKRLEKALFVHRRTSNITAMMDGAKPRQICCALPATAPARGAASSLYSKFLVSDSSLEILDQKQPRLVNGQYSLNFFGRAIIASVKNLQLADADDRICFQLGKVSENSFNVDFAEPFTPFLAFGLAVSQFIS